MENAYIVFIQEVINYIDVSMNVPIKQLNHF